MVKKYFANFPLVTVKVSGQYHTVTDITARAVFKDFVKANALIYYPYDIKSEQRADVIAYRYYGDSAYTWLVYYSNDIMNPHEEWVKGEDEFLEYLETKYGHLDPSQTGLSYAANTVKNYKTGNGYIVDATTWANLSGDQGTSKTSQTIYDWEFEQNEARRSIKLVGKQYLDQITSEIGKVFT